MQLATDAELAVYNDDAIEDIDDDAVEPDVGDTDGDVAQPAKKPISAHWRVESSSCVVTASRRSLPGSACAAAAATSPARVSAVARRCLENRLLCMTYLLKVQAAQTLIGYVCIDLR